MSTFRLGVLGNPVAHSRSPDIHQQFANAAGITLTYEKVLVPDGRFQSVAKDFLDTGHGFNITLPCKHDAWRFVDESSKRADRAQAVNTVSRDASGKLLGDNTDGPGLVNDIVKNLGWQVRDKRVLVIGAGGAVSGVLSSLLDENPETVHITNRTHGKAQQLEQQFSGTTAVTIDELESGYDLVINGTSAGLIGEDLEIPGKVINRDSRCYDMIYGPGVTRFNQWCLTQADCMVADGLGMLVEQAMLAFVVWFGDLLEKPPETKSVINSIRTTLG